jgi:hypothetical protein
VVALGVVVGLVALGVCCAPALLVSLTCIKLTGNWEAFREMKPTAWVVAREFTMENGYLVTISYYNYEQKLYYVKWLLSNHFLL